MPPMAAATHSSPTASLNCTTGIRKRLARCFDRWKKFDAGRQAHARQALERVRDHAGLSRDVLEVVTRALGQA